MEGYIKIHRSIWDWEWCDDAPTVLLWLYLLSMANYEDKRWHGIVIRRGQLVVSVDLIKRKLKLSTQQIRTRLERLEKAEQIIKETTNRFTLLTICNYDKYQCNEVEEQQTNNKQATNSQQTNNNYIRNKEGEEYISTTTTRTHVREFDTETKLDILRDLYQNETWIEDSSQLLMMDSGIVKELITKFALEIKTSDTDDSRNEAELFAHLKNYLRLSKRIKETSNGSNNSDRNDKRRGTLPTATSASEYSTTF